MAFAEQLARQLAHPSGVGGLLLGTAMDLANRRITHRAIELLAPAPADRVLDVGCGTGKALELVRKTAGCSIVGIDPSQRMLDVARRRLGPGAELHKGLIEVTPVEPGSFDAILALNVLYFAREDGTMLAALHRLLRPGGRLIAYVTARETMERWSFVRAGYHRLFDETELANILLSGGFAAGSINIRSENVGAGAVGLFAYAMR